MRLIKAVALIVLAGMIIGEPWASGLVVSEYGVHVYGTEKADSFSAVAVAPNGDIILGGQSSYLGIPLPWLVRVDRYGNIIWSRVYKFNRTVYRGKISALAVGKDGSIIAGGTIEESDTRELFVMKLDENGTVQWSYQYDVGDMSMLRSLGEDDNGNIVVTGFSPNIQEIIILKLNPYGNVIWSKKLNCGATGIFHAAKVRPDGEILLAYVRESDLILTKLRSNGLVSWAKVYKGVLFGDVSGIDEDENGLIVSGSTIDGNVWVMQTDPSGNLKWVNVYSTPNNDEAVGVASSNGGIFIVASSYNSTAAETWVFETDASGEVSRSALYSQGIPSSVSGDYGKLLVAGTTVKFNSFRGSDGILMSLPLNGAVIDGGKPNEPAVFKPTNKVEVSNTTLSTEFTPIKAKPLNPLPKNVCLTVPVILKISPPVSEGYPGSVYVDGNYTSPAFSKVHLSLCPGEHELVVKRSGYFDYVSTINVVPGWENVLTIKLSKKPEQKGKLLIDSTPEGAAVYINGTLMGITPLNLTLTPGKYSIRVTKGGYIEYSTEVYLPKNGSIEIKAKLQQTGTKTSSTTTTATTSTGESVSQTTHSTTSTPTTTETGNSPTSTSKKGGGGICGPALIVALALAPLLWRHRS
ncbi:PEGA domain-containing protein [Thermococcus sp. Bubb.Bath]|uniref:PEGA domain-containing protein n=1 Tax=Thermococcus sp. Bubb.Bath TaxID=1638242 RepID=UPI0014399B6D|nr:PEGA domain-containing protein [Thermococcus sp. Bubb.Bath]NJF24141.1 PEGA domain-containing protein [Thermococcus sp. Bubb.Bath]